MALEQRNPTFRVKVGGEWILVKDYELLNGEGGPMWYTLENGETGVALPSEYAAWWGRDV